AARAAPAVVTRSTPSAPSPRRRSHRAATPAGVNVNRASGSGSTTKSFSVPCPLANLTASGYVPPGRQGPFDVVGGGAVQPDDPVVPAEPGPLPAHVAAGADEGAFPGLGQRLPRRRLRCGTRPGVQRGQHLGVTQR